MKVLVAGAGGLVGSSVTKYCMAAGDEVFGHKRLTLDITNAELVSKIILENRPDAVINCAAWTDVDGCESNQERAFLVNAKGPENLANVCREIGATFVTISTDYVFDGTKQGFYTQRDDPNPKSIYGVSKLEGERNARETNPQTVIVRTGFVFGQGGTNFLSTILERAQQGSKLRAIVDALGTPTYASDLASRLRELALKKIPDVFHIVNAGDGATYVDFARFALRSGGLDQSLVEPVTSSSLNRPAPRPANSCLRCLVSDSAGLAPMPDWREAVRAFAREPTTAHRVAPGAP